MFGLSFGELVIIFGVALLVLGPKGLPEMARKLGGWMRQFRSATSELRGTFEGEFYKMDGGPASPVRPAMRSVEGVVPRPSGPSSSVMAPGGASVPAPAPPTSPLPTSSTPLAPAATEAALDSGLSGPLSVPAATPAERAGTEKTEGPAPTKGAA